jgi:type VI secretion system protein ImpC
MAKDRPMVLAVLADFGGRREPGTRHLRRVDRETLDAVMTRLGVEVEVPDGDDLARLRLQGMEDFHPDVLVRRVPGLQRLLGSPDEEPPPMPATPAPAVPSGESLLDSILGEPRPEVSAARGAIHELARRLAEPSTVRTRRGRAADVDHRLADGVRAVLYSARFHGLEATWRDLAELVREAETGDDLQIYLLDADRDEAPLLLAEELATPGAPRSMCVLVAYAFGAGDHDLAVLERYGAVALAAGMPVVADASPTILGLDDARELADADVRRRIGMGTGPAAWRAFRSSPAATNVSLVLPRVLVRAPYGRAGEPVTTFPFDEGLTGRDHGRFLWGSGALAYGRVLARAFAAEGWDADLDRYAELDGLPVHVWREGGEECVLPCAEVAMSDATVARIVEEGVMVAASVRGQDRVVMRR